MGRGKDTTATLQMAAGRRAEGTAQVPLVTLPPQLIVLRGHERPQAEKIEPISSNGHAIPLGGLWTSTFRNGSSAWSEGAGHGESAYLLSPKPSSVYSIDGIADLDGLVVQYARDDGTIDWERLAQDYDAVSLTEDGLDACSQHSQSDMHSLSFSTWDCESTLWFRWRFSSCEPAPRV